MSNCSNVQTGVISESATAKTDIKAVNKAIKKVRKAGKSLCVGGSCTTFGTFCTYKLGSMEIEVKQVVESDGIFYEATVDSSGHCKCE